MKNLMKRKGLVDEIADALEIEPQELSAALDVALKEVQSMDEEQLNEYLFEAAVDIDEEDAYLIFECVIELVLADKILKRIEVSNLITMADALGIDTEDAILMLVDMVKENPQIKIDMHN